MDVPVTVLSDGGEDIRHAYQLPAAAERVLDWFHIGMHFEHLLVFLRGLRGAAADERAQLERRAEGAKWFPWHGKWERCLQRLESLRRDTGWVGGKNPFGRLILYLTAAPIRRSTTSVAARRADRSQVPAPSVLSTT